MKEGTICKANFVFRGGQQYQVLPEIEKIAISLSLLTVFIGKLTLMIFSSESDILNKLFSPFLCLQNNDDLNANIEIYNNLTFH